MSARSSGVSGLAPNQLFFPFIPAEHQQELQQLWAAHFARADAGSAKRAANAREKLRLKVVDGQTLAIDWSKSRQLLDVRLLGNEASELDVQAADDQEDSKQLAVIGSDADLPESYEWSEKDIRIVHEQMLVYSLNLLKSRGNAEEKFDILRWIWAPDVFCWVTRSVAGVQRSIPIQRRQLPFTFEMCCRMTGYDADRLRDGLAHVLKPLLKQLGISTVTTE